MYLSNTTIHTHTHTHTSPYAHNKWYCSIQLTLAKLEIMSLPGANPGAASQLREGDSRGILLVRWVMKTSPLLMSRAATWVFEMVMAS